MWTSTVGLSLTSMAPLAVAEVAADVVVGGNIAECEAAPVNVVIHTQSI